MQKLKIVTAIAAMMMASPVLAQEITVWDVNVDDAAHATYYDHAKAAFEAAHPGATLNLLSQPDAEYYTLLGTALASKAMGSTSYVHATLATGETIIAERRSSQPRTGDKIMLHFALTSARLFGDDGERIR